MAREIPVNLTTTELTAIVALLEKQQGELLLARGRMPQGVYRAACDYKLKRIETLRRKLVEAL